MVKDVGAVERLAGDKDLAEVIISMGLHKEVSVICAITHREDSVLNAMMFLMPLWG